MYAALGPLLRVHFGLSDGGVLLVRFSGRPPWRWLRWSDGWSDVRTGSLRCGAFLVAAAGLAAEAATATTLWPLIPASAVHVAGVPWSSPHSVP